MSMIVNLCELVNTSFALMNPNEIHDTKRRELLDYFLGGSMDSEGKTAIKFFRSTERFTKGYFKIRKQFPNCNPTVGTGSLCGKDASVAPAFQKYEKDIYLSDFQERKSNGITIQSEGTLFDYCVAIGQNELLQDFVNQIISEAWSIRTQMNIDLGKVLANNVSNYPDGTPFNPAAPKALSFYAYDNTTTPPLAIVNPAALAIVDAQLEMLNEQKQWRAIGGTLLKGVSNVIQASPTFGNMTFPTVLRDGVYDVDIPKNLVLNRPLMYLAQRDAIDVLTYNWSMNRSGTLPLSTAEVLDFMEKAMASSQPTGDVMFPATIDGLTYDVQMKWEKCGRDLTLSAQLFIYTYFHVPTITSCSGVGILAYDICPIAEAESCAPTVTPDFDYLCLDFAPVTECAEYITGDYTLTLPDSSIITGTVSGNANVTTENGIFALLQSIFAKNTIAGIVRNKCGDYMLTAMVNGYAFASGDVITLNFPCLAAPITITVANCVGCNCTLEECFATNITATRSTVGADEFLTISPTFQTNGLSIVSYDWSGTTFSSGSTPVNTAVKDLVINLASDETIDYELNIVTSNGQSLYFNGIIRLNAYDISMFVMPFITKNGNVLTYNSNSNETKEKIGEVQVPQGNAVYVTPAIEVRLIVGNYTLPTPMPNDTLYRFYINGTDKSADGYYNCATQGGVLRQAAPVKRSVQDTTPIAAPKTKAKAKA